MARGRIAANDRRVGPWPGLFLRAACGRGVAIARPIGRDCTQHGGCAGAAPAARIPRAPQPPFIAAAARIRGVGMLDPRARGEATRRDDGDFRADCNPESVRRARRARVAVARDDEAPVVRMPRRSAWSARAAAQAGYDEAVWYVS